MNNKNGEVMINYVEVIKKLSIKGELSKVLRNVKNYILIRKK